MKKSAAVALSALTLFSALAPVLSTEAEARRRHRGAWIAGGIALGVAAAAIAANSNRAYADDGYYYRRARGFGYSCRKWYRQCEDGYDYACEKFERRGC